MLRKPESCDRWWGDSFGTVFQTVSVKKLASEVRNGTTEENGATESVRDTVKRN
jgi:hypothetical protein